MYQNNKIYFAVAGFLIAGLVLMIFVIRPLFKNIKEFSEQLFLFRQELVLLENKAQQSSVLEEKFQVLEPKLKRIKNLFVSSEMPVDFIQFLEIMAGESNVEINISLVPQKAKSKEETAFSFLQFQLSVLGASPNCLQFLEKLETAPYLIEIDNLNVRRIAEEQLKTEKHQEFFVGDTEFNFSIKVFTNSQ